MTVGSFADTHANSGIDQGCPLSPCGFAAAVELLSRAFLSETRSRLDGGAKLWAYPDDWYVWFKPRHIPAAVELISNVTRTINLELQPTKIQIWTASCNSPIPPAFQDKAKPTQKCLRAHLGVAGDSEGSPVELGGRSLHADRHTSLSNHIGHPARTKSSRPQDADGQRPAHHVRGSGQPTRPAHDVRPGRGSFQL